MVHGDFGNGNNPEAGNAYNRWQMIRMAHCMKVLGRGVIRVINRVDDARRNNILGIITDLYQ